MQDKIHLKVLNILFKVDNDIHKTHRRYNHYLDNHKILLNCLIKMILKMFLNLFYLIK